MSKVIFSDKVQTNPYEAAKWNAQDANEIKKSLNDAYDALNGIAAGADNAVLTGTPAVNIKVYNVSQAGTYTNFGGVVVSSSDLAAGFVQLRLIGSTWNKVITALDLSLYATKAEMQPEKISDVYTTIFTEYSTPLAADFSITAQTNSISSQPLININPLLKTSGKQSREIEIRFSAAAVAAKIIKFNTDTNTYTELATIQPSAIVVNTVQKFSFPLTTFAANETVGVIGACYYLNTTTYGGALYGTSFASNPLWTFSYRPLIYTRESRLDLATNAIQAQAAINSDQLAVISGSVYQTTEKETVSNFQWVMANTNTNRVVNLNPTLRASGLKVSKVNIKFSGNAVDGKIHKVVVNNDNTIGTATLLMTIPKAEIQIGVIVTYTLPAVATLAANETIAIEGALYYGGSGMQYPGAVYGTAYNPAFTFSYNLITIATKNRLDDLGLFERTPVRYDRSKLGTLDFQPLIADGYNHIINYGQSLSKGAESYTALSTNPLSNTFMVGANLAAVTGAFSPLRAVQGAGNEMEPPVVGAVNALRKRLDKTHLAAAKLIGSAPGVGGKTIELLSKEATNGGTAAQNIYNAKLLSTINAAKANAGATRIVCPAIVYMQGEYNQTARVNEGLTTGSTGTADKNEYKALLMTLKNNMQADIMSIYGQEQKPLFFLYLTSAKFTGLDIPATRAQYEFAEENNDVILLNPHYYVPTAHDNSGHLNANGSRWYGEQIAKALFETLVNQINYNPVIPKNITAFKNSLYIDCYVPCAPLVFDTKILQVRQDYGFEVYINSVKMQLSSIKIIGGTSIRIDLASPIAGTVKIIYAGASSNGYGNLRDSDEELAFANYIDETTLTVNDIPPYTPLDSNGVNYYGKKYPLYNWLANFEKTITV